MLSKGFGIISLVVVGLVAADIFSHPTGTAAAANGFTQIETPVISGLVNAPAPGRSGGG